MSFSRGLGGAEPIRPEPVGQVSGPQEERRVERTWRMAVGTLACSACDAPVAPSGSLSPADPLACPFCGYAAAVRDFLSLATPARPARVEVRVTERRRVAIVPAPQRPGQGGQP